MQSIIHFFRRLLYLPVEFVSSPTIFISELWNDQGRGRTMVLAAPAIFVFIACLATLAWSKMVSGPNLIIRYDALAEKSQQEARIVAAQRPSQGDDSETMQEKFDERVAQLRELLNQEKVFLDKLIELDSENPDYKFRLAMVSLKQGNLEANDSQKQGHLEKCFSLIQVIAPVDKAGYGNAHLWLAKSYRTARVKTKQRQTKNWNLALTHVNFCLVRDKNNIEAKKLKGDLLARMGRAREAYEIFNTLVVEDPSVYQWLVSLNRALKRPERNPQVLKDAMLKYRDRVSTHRENTELWTDAWKNYLACLRQLKDFGNAEQAVEKEIASNPEDLGRKKFLELELANVYNEWAGDVGTRAQRESGLGDAEFRRSSETVREQLNYVTKAFRLNPSNEFTLKFLTNLGLQPGFEEEVKKIYDGLSDPNAPVVVLAEIGSNFLANKDYDSAIRYFESARQKLTRMDGPNDPQILNNLAYAYLLCDNRNPDRALMFVEQAIKAIEENNSKRLVRAANFASNLSHFYDTRGFALLQLSRFDEAAANFEIALRARPQNVDILRKLVQCYEGRMESQAESYRRRIKQILDQSAKKDTETLPDENGATEAQGNGTQ